MDKLLRNLKSDWEKTMFWVLLFTLIATLSAWLLGGNEGRKPVAEGSARKRIPLLGDNAYAFLAPPDLERLPSNPFSFGYKAERRPWQRSTKPAATAKPTRTTPAARPTPTRPTAKPVKPAASAKPAAPPPARILTYRGYLESTSGTMVAFVSVADPATKKSSMVQLAVGRDIDGIKVTEFSGDVLQVIDPKGTPRQIAKGARKKIVLE